MLQRKVSNKKNVPRWYSNSNTTFNKILLALNFPKNEHFLPSDTHSMCAYQGVNVCFSENLPFFVFLKHPFWDSPFWLITDDIFISPIFFSFWVACKRHKSTIRICTECRYYALVGAPYCYLDMFDRLQRLLCRTLGPTFAASLISLTCRCSKSFCKHYFGRWLNWLLSHNLVWVLPVILTSHTFSVNIPRFPMDVYVNDFFLCTVSLWNLTYRKFPFELRSPWL